MIPTLGQAVESYLTDNGLWPDEAGQVADLVAQEPSSRGIRWSNLLTDYPEEVGQCPI
jgi:hypothetical protein